jgi:hypothetical protein
MAQTGSPEWAEGWGVVKQVHQKFEFVAFFDTQEDAEAAAGEAGIDCQVCWVWYRKDVGFGPRKDRED